jgi:hypothetical protein
VQLRHTLERCAFRCAGLCQPVILREQSAELSQTRGNSIEYGLVTIFGNVLLQVRGSQGFVPPDLALVGFGQAADYAKQRCLTRAVSANQTYAFAAIDLEIDVAQQWHMAIRKRDVFKAKERHQMV